MQKPGGFFQCVCAVGNDDAPHIGLRQPIHAAPCERLPSGVVNVFAVNLGHLFADQLVVLQDVLNAWHSIQQVLDAQLTRVVSGVVPGTAPGARYGAPVPKTTTFLIFFPFSTCNTSKTG